MSAKAQRIGLLGGTFNPVHFGHLRAAEEVAETLGLNRVLFIPSAVPPHKDPSPLVPVRHRLRMTRLAVAGRTGFQVSDVEAKRSGPSWTVDTVRHYRNVYPNPALLFFLCGLDALLEIHAWKDYRRLFRSVRFVVMTRPGANPKRLAPYLRDRVSAAYKWSAPRMAYAGPGLKPVHFAPVSRMDISSTDIRRRFVGGRSVRYLIPEPVREYILEKGLYRKGEERNLR